MKADSNGIVLHCAVPREEMRAIGRLDVGRGCERRSCRTRQIRVIHQIGENGREVIEGRACGDMMIRR